MEHSSDDIRATLIDGLSQLGLRLDDEVIDKTVAYFQLLLTRNQAVNLISPKQDILTQTVVHLVDSLSLLLIDNLPHQAEALDFGSGGGLPAIPISLARPDWRYTLVESTGKKAAFLSFVKNELELDRVTVVNRFLEAGKNTENVFYDFVTARAVSEVGQLAAIAGPRLKPGGIFVAYKGPQGLAEIEASRAKLKKWRLDLIDQRNFILPLIKASRTLLVFKKV